jgi:hypothetical protein
MRPDRRSTLQLTPLIRSLWKPRDPVILAFMSQDSARPSQYYDYLICLECESPCYVFDFKAEELVDALCEVCGNDDIDLFLSEEDFEGLASQ